MKQLFFSLLILWGIGMCAQNEAITKYCEKDLKTKYDSIKSINKLIRKYKWSKSLGKSIELCYTIANRFRQHNDTGYVQWYQTAIDLLKKNYCKTKKAEIKKNILFMIAVCYYYTNQYDEARTYFSKTIACRALKYSSYYYLGVIAKKQKNVEEATTIFKEFGKLTNLNVDSLLN